MGEGVHDAQEPPRTRRSVRNWLTQSDRVARQRLDVHDPPSVIDIRTIPRVANQLDKAY